MTNKAVARQLALTADLIELTGGNPFRARAYASGARTVERLEARVADLLGKEAGLFVPSGVMGNQIAIRLHAQPGDEVVVAERSHIYHYEGAAPAALWGVQCAAMHALSLGNL